MESGVFAMTHCSFGRRTEAPQRSRALPLETSLAIFETAARIADRKGLALPSVAHHGRNFSAGAVAMEHLAEVSRIEGEAFASFARKHNRS
jgi:hypothetical protein